MAQRVAQLRGIDGHVVNGEQGGEGFQPQIWICLDLGQTSEHSLAKRIIAGRFAAS